ncbi:DUF2231 domain-containing protein [Microlunatus sp. Gsoil 973]|uniref:DUF2231 domain-containing protein n=1 Tax=Microlunatus sp. Gsoil 973 TaxID=2672569 RepID=UPI0012B44E9C|nr:DUF2231 domain-containing protein [Microlunatus sp. Gsoil 973]QGN31656.1 hypothetical protein GJV80_01115 [Microlunatus sp. Gsoil 973]
MTINGLPAHALLVHLVVVLLPLTSVMAILGSLWPTAQRKFGFLTPLAALGGVVVVPITIQAGLQLAGALHMGAAIAEHEMFGKRVLPFAIALFVTTAAQWVYLRFLTRRRWLTIVIAALVIAAAIGTTVQVSLAGDAGAHQVWGSVANNP